MSARGPGSAWATPARRTWPGAQGLLAQINLLLRQAEERQTRGRNAPVYVELDPTGSGDYWRSEVLAGRAVLDPNTLGGYWQGRGRLTVTVRWLRRPWWEGAESELALGTAGSYARGGVTVWNHADADAGHRNWFDVDPACLDGDLPAPIKIALQRTDGGAMCHRVLIGAGALAPGSTWAPLLEGEAASEVTQTPAEPSEALSGGYAGLLAEPQALESQLGIWVLGSAWLAECRGEWFRVYARLAPQPAWTRLRMKLLTAAGIVWSGPEVVLAEGHELQNLGVIQLPPGNLGASMDLFLELDGRFTGTGTPMPVVVDYLAFVPLRGFRRYEPSDVGVGVGQGDWLVDDAPAGQIYIIEQGGQVPGYVVIGRALEVAPDPARSARFVVLWENSYGEAPADMSGVVRAWYRPRRASL